MASNASPYTNAPDTAAEHDASWETLPMTNRRPAPSVFPKTILNGLAALLVISLCIVLVELNNPGTASMVAGKVFGSNSQTKVGIKQAVVSPVPAPFVAPKISAPSRVEMAGLTEPTSEPSVFPTPVPTSEPTAFSEKTGFSAYPTSEPTQFPSLYIKGHHKKGSAPPTSEPSTFPTPVPTSEPTLFGGQPTIVPPAPAAPSVSETFTPTSDPTTFPTPNAKE